ncbi:MAG: phenylalanine--tRNA ligase subunit beta, partial [Acidimicrobiia bacterium]|nr:phenylalanine--tRNA ligase subunit beta [Acidimicrobiia bacterium]
IPPFHPERGARILHRGVTIGAVGEIHPAVAERFGVQGRVTAAEVELASVLADPGLWSFAAPSPFPPAVFDLAFEVPDGSSTKSVLDVVRAADDVEDVHVFDVFHGGSIADGHRSIAIRVTMRAGDRTLTDDDVAPAREAIVASVVAATQSRLRGAL